MNFFEIIKHLLPLLALVYGVHGECRFNRAQIEGSNGVFTYQDAKGLYHLQRTSSVPDDTKLQIFCTSTEKKETTCLKQTHIFKPELPLKCSKPMVATIKHIADKSCPAAMYAVGYTIEKNFLELYRTCYDKAAVRAIYAEAHIYPKKFYPQRPCMEFSTDGLITARDASSFLTRNIFKTFKRIYGEQQKYIKSDKDIVLNRGHLTASADFLFGDQMCATFKYANVVPQFQSINDGNWDSIERWLRNKIPTTASLIVRTGAVGVLNLEDSKRKSKAAYLAGGTKNPVPLWTYKLVKTAENKPLYAFITYNNIFAEKLPAAPGFCKKTICPTDLKLTSSAKRGFSFCCDPTHFNPV